MTPPRTATATLGSGAASNLAALPAPTLGLTDAPPKPLGELAAQRLDWLLDEGAPRLTLVHGDGVIAVRGKIGGEVVCVFVTDNAIQGGALGADGCAAIVAAYHQARCEAVPVIGIWHSGGARLREGILGLHGVGEVFSAMTAASGRIPQISVVLGPAAGGAAYGPALTDIVVLGPKARVFVTGPDVIRKVTGEDCDPDALGGTAVHASRSGVAHIVTDSDESALHRARALVGLMHPARRCVNKPVTQRDLSALLPDNRRWAYDVRPLVDGLLDGPGEELSPDYSPNVVTVLGELGGRAVGVVANNPAWMAGCLDSPSAEKAARFVRMCDAFGIPLVVLVDVPGYLPGIDQEWAGVVRRGAKLLHAFAGCSVPRITLVTRKAHGGAYIAMNSRSLGADAVFAWPGAEIAVMSSLAAVEVIHRRELAAATADQRDTLAAGFAAKLDQDKPGLAEAVEAGLIDAVIDPADTRHVLADTLARLSATTRIRGSLTNIPL